MLASFDIGQHTANAHNLSRRQYPKEFLASVLNKYTVDLMEYFHLTDNPNYRALWRKSYRNKLGLLTKGMPVRVKGTCTILFIDKADIPADLWKDVTYGCIVISYRPKKGIPQLHAPHCWRQQSELSWVLWDTNNGSPHRQTIPQHHNLHSRGTLHHPP